MNTKEWTDLIGLLQLLDLQLHLMVHQLSINLGIMKKQGSSHKIHGLLE